MPKHVDPGCLEGRVLDVHTHCGLHIHRYAQMGFPYCSSVEDLYYRMRANGVDCAVVFPTSAHMHFDLDRCIRTGELVTVDDPVSKSPYELENRMLLKEIFEFCPELQASFIPFLSVDPGRSTLRQIDVLEELSREYPVYGLKINPVECQSRVDHLLEEGEVFLDFAAERNWPLLFHVSTNDNEQFSHASQTFRVIEKHPELRYCLAHCIGFNPEYLKKADRMANVWVDTSALKIQVDSLNPAESVSSFASERFHADLNDFRVIMRALVDAFADTMLWGTDAPCHSYIMRRFEGKGTWRDFNLKGRYEDEKAALDALDPGGRKTVMRNSRRFLFG